MESVEDKIQLADEIRLKAKNADEKCSVNKDYAQKANNKLKVKDEEISKISTRLKELESGKGRCLTNYEKIHIYEYWIETPAYSGPIRGTYATLNQTGNIQHVPVTTGKSKGGYASALFGAQVAGPTGAVAGGILGRKNEVETTIKTVDTRQFHVDIKGRNWAWSVTFNSGFAEKVGAFRDLINVLGSSNDDPKALLAEQRQIHDTAAKKRLELFNELAQANNSLENAQREYDKIKNEYAVQRVPLLEDAKFRWSKLSSLQRFFLYVIGPLPVGICFLSPLAILSGHLVKDKALMLVIFGITYLIALFYVYFNKFRSC